MSFVTDIVLAGAGCFGVYNAPLLTREVSRFASNYLAIDPSTDIEIETTERIKASKGDNEREIEVLVYRDGSLGFMLEITGSLMLSGATERADIRRKITEALSSAMEQDGVSIQYVFQRDPEQSGRVSHEIHRPMRETAKRLRLNLDGMFNAKEKDFAKKIETESHYWVVTVRPDILPARVRKFAQKKRQSLISSYPRAEDVQRIGTALVELKDGLYGLMKTVMGALAKAGLDSRLLEAREAVGVMSRMLDPSLAGSFKPVLPGDDLPTRIHPTTERSVVENNLNPGTILWPSLGKQILRESPSLPTPNVVVLGGRRYASFSVRLLPAQTVDFGQLLKSLSNDSVPYRVSVRTTSNGPTMVGYRQTMAQALQRFGTTNAQLHAAMNRVREYQMENEPQVKVQVDLVTWAPESDEDLLMRRVETLVSAYQSLGSAQIERHTNRSWLGYLETVPGLRLTSGANPSCIRLNDALSLIPISRPSSPWAHEPASMMFRYPDGKVLPFDPTSSMMGAKVFAVSGPQGHGKSVFLMAYCMSVICAPGNTTWPYIAYFDIGPGSSGLTSLLKSSLTDEEKDYAQHVRVDRDPKKSAMNPFDLPLGYLAPTPHHKAFLIDFLCLIAPLAEQHRGFLELLVSRAYQNTAPMFAGGDPHIYTRGFDSDVDRLYDQYETEIQEGAIHKGVPWWTVVDVLFRHGHIAEAITAQSMAVPNLTTMVGLPLDPELSSMYKAVPGTSESDPLPQYVNRCIAEATRLYPYVCNPTKITIGRSKVVAFDLDKVCPRGDGESSRREAAIAFLVARQLVAGAWKTDFDEIDTIRAGTDPSGNPLPLVSEYREYHQKRIQSIKGSPKVFLYDEKYRTKGIEAINRVIQEDNREGRKYNIYIGIASQAIDDMEDDILKLATAVFILGAGSVDAAEQVSNLFHFNPTTRAYVRDRLMKAGPHGANMIASYSTARGRFTQYQLLSLGPVEMWAYQSDPIDANLRNILYREADPDVVRNFLAARFPGGSAHAEVKRRRAALPQTVSPDDAAVQEDIVESLAADLRRDMIRYGFFQEAGEEEAA